MKTFRLWLFESHTRNAVSDIIEDAQGLEQVQNALSKVGIVHSTKTINGHKVIIIPDSNLVVYDFDKGYGGVDEVGDFIYSSFADDLKEADDFNKNFWDNPTTLYHATTEENAGQIKLSGLKSMCKTRGTGNRSVGCDVFTSMNLDDLLSGEYGNTILAINADAMKKDRLTPPVELEPGIQEYHEIQNLLNKLGLDYPVEAPNDLYLDTVIVYGNIPAKYLSIHK